MSTLLWIRHAQFFSCDDVHLDPDSSPTLRHDSMSSSRANIRLPSEDLNESSRERGEQEECSNIDRLKSQQDFEELLLGQVSALESTFNEAMKYNHQLQAHSNFTSEEFEETKSRTDNPIEGVDQNVDKNCSEEPLKKEKLQGKRTASSRGIGINSDGGTSDKRSRSLSPVTS